MRRLGFYALGALLVILVSYFGWDYFVPRDLSREALRWDESNRLRDSLQLLMDLRDGKLWAPFLAIYTASTWGAFFPIVGAGALAGLGVSAHSLTFVSFLALPFLIGIGVHEFWRARKLRLAFVWVGAISLVLVSMDRIAPFWTILMLEGWGVFGWAWFFLALYLDRGRSLLAACWFLMLLRPTYYVYFLLAALLFLAFNQPIKTGLLRLATFLRNLKTSSKCMFAFMCILALHIIVAKLGYVEFYGKPSWAGHRALRTPVHVGFILFVVLMYRERQSFFDLFDLPPWIGRWVKYFFFPASLWMAVPWPNRWAPIVLIQSFGSTVAGFEDRFLYYPRQWVSLFDNSWMLYLMTFMLILGVLSLVFSASRWKRFALIMLALQAYLIALSSSNYELRFAIHLFYLIPVLGFVWLGSLMPRSFSLMLGAGLLASSVAIAVRDSESGEPFFARHLHPWTLNYKGYEEIYPLEESLSGFLRQQEEEHSRVVVLSDRAQNSWEKTFYSFNLQQEYKEKPLRVDVQFPKAAACAAAKEIQAIVLRPESKGWSAVACE